MQHQRPVSALDFWIVSLTFERFCWNLWAYDSMCKIWGQLSITMLTWYCFSWQSVSFYCMKDSNLWASGNLSELLLSICLSFWCLKGFNSDLVLNLKPSGKMLVRLSLFLEIMTGPISRKPCHSEVSWNYGNARLQQLPGEVEQNLQMCAALSSV